MKQSNATLELTGYTKIPTTKTFAIGRQTRRQRAIFSTSEGHDWQHCLQLNADTHAHLAAATPYMFVFVVTFSYFHDSSSSGKV